MQTHHPPQALQATYRRLSTRLLNISDVHHAGAGSAPRHVNSWAGEGAHCHLVVSESAAFQHGWLLSNVSLQAG